MTGGDSKRKLGEAMTLNLHGDVGFDFTPKTVADALQSAGSRPITVSLHSAGGDALAGVAIHNMLARHPAQVTVIVEGLAASAASLIAAAGKRVIMPDNAFLMIHDAWGAAVGNADDMRDMAEVLAQVSAAYVRGYARRTGLGEEELRALMADETWLDAKRAVELKFADEVTAPVLVRAMTNRLHAFRNVPACLRDGGRRDGERRKSERVAEGVECSGRENIDMTDGTTEVQVVAQAEAPVAAPRADGASVMARAKHGATVDAPAKATIAELEHIAACAQLGADFVLAQFKAGATRERAQEAALEILAARSPMPVAPEANHAASVTVIADEGEKRFDAMARALAHRAGLTTELDASARAFRGLTLLQMAAECLEMSGVRTRGMSPDRIAIAAMRGAAAGAIFAQSPGAHTSSHFTNLVANTAMKALGVGYTSSPRTFLQWARRRTLRDFKTFRVVNLSGAPALQPIASAGQEHNSILFGAITEMAEQYQLQRFGRRVAVSYELVVNDDLAAFTRVPQMFGAAAARAESDAVYGILNSNPNMSDGVALFNTAHVNVFGNGVPGYGVGSGVLNIDGLNNGQDLLLRQTALNGDILGLSPRYLVVPSRQAATALQLTSSAFQPNAPTSVNPFAGALVAVVEPRLASATQWYLIADPNAVDTIEYAYLEGAEEPQVSVYTDEATDATVIKCTHSFGAKAIDWRGMVRSTGT